MRWTVLCVSDDPSALLLYQSILELDGHSVLVAKGAHEALEVSKGLRIDCVVLDHETDAISIAKEIARARPGLQILVVSDQSEAEFDIYAEAGMFISKDEAIEELSRCIHEVLRRDACERIDAHNRNSVSRKFVGSRPLHGALVKWLLPW